MSVTLKQLSSFLEQHGMPSRVEGDPSQVITAVNTLEDATERELSFLANPKYERLLSTTRAGAVIISDQQPTSRSMTYIRTPQPYPALMASIVLIHGYRKHPRWGVHPAAQIATSAVVGSDANIGPHVTIDERVRIGDRVVIYPGCYVGSGTVLGDDVTLYPNVIIYEEVSVGSRVAIHAGTVIGEDGLGYAPKDDCWFKIPQVGNVIIEDDVEIGANCTIDRATLGTTKIGKGSKLSNLIAIGHGTQIGEHAMFVAQVGLAGSVSVGHHVQMGGQAGVVGHVRIGDHVSVGAKAGVASDIQDHMTVLGQPAIKSSDAKRVIYLTQKLPDLKQRIKALEAEVRRLTCLVETSDIPQQPRA